jgi:hypothetical protein
MLLWLTSLLGASTERRFRSFLHGAGAVATVALLAAVALGFGTLASYVYLRASQGTVVAAFIICVVYSLFAILIGVSAIVRGRADRLVRGAPSEPTENGHSLFQSLDGTGASQDQQALLAALQAGCKLSPLQLFATALIGGLIAGRKLGK